MSKPIPVAKYDRSSVQTMTSRPVQLQRLPSKEKIRKGIYNNTSTYID